MPKRRSVLVNSDKKDISTCSLCASVDGVFTTISQKESNDICRLFDPDAPKSAHIQDLCHRCMFKITTLQDFKDSLNNKSKPKNACGLCGDTPHPELKVTTPSVKDKFEQCYYVNSKKKINETICTNCYFKLELFEEYKKYVTSDFISPNKQNALLSVKKFLDVNMIKVSTSISNDKKMYTLIPKICVIEYTNENGKRKLEENLTKNKKVKQGEANTKISTPKRKSNTSRRGNSNNESLDTTLDLNSTQNELDISNDEATPSKRSRRQAATKSVVAAKSPRRIALSRKKTNASGDVQTEEDNKTTNKDNSMDVDRSESPEVTDELSTSPKKQTEKEDSDCAEEILPDKKEDQDEIRNKDEDENKEESAIENAEKLSSPSKNKEIKKRPSLRKDDEITNGIDKGEDSAKNQNDELEETINLSDDAEQNENDETEKKNEQTKQKKSEDSDEDRKTANTCIQNNENDSSEMNELSTPRKNDKKSSRHVQFDPEVQEIKIDKAVVSDDDEEKSQDRPQPDKEEQNENESADDKITTKKSDDDMEGVDLAKLLDDEQNQINEPSSDSINSIKSTENINDNHISPIRLDTESGESSPNGEADKIVLSDDKSSDSPDTLSSISDEDNETKAV